jgi:hypothetical protein
MAFPQQRSKTQCISFGDDDTGNSCSKHEMGFSRCAPLRKKHHHVIALSNQDFFLSSMYAYGRERKEDR